MRLGIIDLGTNSVRFDVHQVGPGRALKRLHREKIMVRLGQGIFTRGRLDRAAMRRALHAFVHFSKLSRELRVQKVVAFGTSALREARDRDRLLSQIESRTGIRVRVISGAEEAALIAVGILTHEELPKGAFALIDIGGGSTEISICRQKRVLHTMSFPLGTARVQQLFLKTSPPARKSVERARLYIRNTLFQTSIPERWPKVEQMIASSGTARAIHKMLASQPQSKYRAKGRVFHFAGLKALVHQMESLSTSELFGVSGMEPKRVDMILAGSLILEECMDVLGAEKVRITPYSLRDGILEEELKAFRKGAPTQMALHQEDLINKAVVLGLERAHLKRTVKLAEEMFDRIASVHKLSAGWKTYLVAAVILRKSGKVVSLTRFAEHSAYIVRNADLHGMEAWEIELVAALCLHHDSGKVEKSKSSAFLKLLAMLRVVDALDSGPETEIRITNARLERARILLGLRGRKLTGLEATRLELKSRLFREMFKREIVIRSVR